MGRCVISAITQELHPTHRGFESLIGFGLHQAFLGLQAHVSLLRHIGLQLIIYLVSGKNRFTQRFGNSPHIRRTAAGLLNIDAVSTRTWV